MTEPLTRREFLKLSSLVAATLAYSGCVPRPIKESLESESSETVSQKEIGFITPEKDSDVKISFSGEEDIKLHDLQWVPDTKTSYIRNSDGSLSYYLTAGTEGFRLTGESIFELGEPKKVIKPSRDWGEYGFRGYRAPGTVFTDKKGNIWSFDHLEEWVSEKDGSNFTGRIGLSLSKDGGENFVDCGVIIDGSNLQKAGKEVTGAGQPCALIKNENGVDFVYLFYTEWTMEGHYIALARAPLSQIENPDSWSKYANGEFNSPSNMGIADPVISPKDGEAYAALASVSWNDYLRKYLTIFESSTGFWLCLSDNLVDWEKYQKVAEFPKAHDKRGKGEYWYSYPTLLSEETGNQSITSKKGLILYSKGKYQEEPHRMVAREFEIS